MRQVRNRIWRFFHRDPIARWMRGNFPTWLDAACDLDEHYVDALVFIWSVAEVNNEPHNCNSCIGCAARTWLAQRGQPTGVKVGERD